MDLDNGTWVLVADGEKYLLLRNIGDRDYIHLEVVDHETSRNAPSHELSTDRAGRRHDSTVDLPGGVVASGKSAMEETDWRRVAEERFAEHAAETLRELAAEGRFSRLVVAADPRTLGKLREVYGDEVRALITAELDKDLTNLPLEKIEASIKAAEA